MVYRFLVYYVCLRLVLVNYMWNTRCISGENTPLRHRKHVYFPCNSRECVGRDHSQYMLILTPCCHPENPRQAPSCCISTKMQLRFLRFFGKKSYYHLNFYWFKVWRSRDTGPYFPWSFWKHSERARLMESKDETGKTCVLVEFLACFCGQTADMYTQTSVFVIF